MLELLKRNSTCKVGSRSETTIQVKYLRKHREFIEEKIGKDERGVQITNRPNRI